MSRTLLSLLAVLLLVVSACGGADDTSSTEVAEPAEETEPAEEEAADGGTVTIEHYSGTDEVPVDPETVVVMDLGVLMSLDALGITPDAFGSLGTPLPPGYAEVAENPDFAPVGTAFEPDYEAINALEPDLILVATRSSATYPDMSEIAPTVDLTFAEDVDFMTAFRDRHTQIGEIFGVEDEVAAQLDEMDRRIEEIAAQTGDAGEALVVLTAGTEVSAYGPGSRFGLVHDVLGFAPADESLARDETHGEAVSFEFILEAEPDVMFVIDRSAAIGEEGAESAEAILDNDLVAQTPAAVEGQIHYVDGADWYLAFNSIPGVQGILDDVEDALG
ncbi:siderophore ABC transporter substrate-binding protein [Euzebya sp.]|uniref:siderophore ABC transporter substrate-binding protein n=1 Tax=Euzebya sp. TaxID=1971409 RepID=UPI003514444D